MPCFRVSQSLLLCALAVMTAVGAAVLVAADDGVSPDFTASVPETIPRQTVEQARRQAQILHTSVHSTLQLVHENYYREDEGLPLPASILRQVFQEIETQQNISLRWLAVEGQAMNTDHIAQTPFETEAVRALKAGEPAYEQIDEGVFRRAARITLSNHCLKCHVPDRKSTEDRTAGLIIAIPVQD